MGDTAKSLAKTIAKLKKHNSNAKHLTDMRLRQIRDVQNKLALKTAKFWLVVGYRNNETQNRDIYVICGASNVCDAEVKGCLFRYDSPKYGPKSVQVLLKMQPNDSSILLTLSPLHKTEFRLQNPDFNTTDYQVHVFESLEAATVWHNEHADRT